MVFWKIDMNFISSSCSSTRGEKIYLLFQSSVTHKIINPPLVQLITIAKFNSSFTEMKNVSQSVELYTKLNPEV